MFSMVFILPWRAAISKELEAGIPKQFISFVY